MIWEIVLYLFLLIAFIVFVKASEFKIFRHRLSFMSRMLIALVFPLLAVFLFIFGVFVLVFIGILILIGLLFWLFGGRIRRV